jgi:pimeloyl-ACP methyl ester carboxylesterase
MNNGAFLAIVISGGVVLLCMLMCCFCTYSNKKWLAAKKIEMKKMTMIADTPKGKIEYKLWGEAPYMLMMPGTPGFAHAAVGFEDFGMGIITVSRPGYGETPLTEELKKAEAQADLIMALMDYLKIEKLPVMAASGSGVIAWRLAIQYPDRI